MLSQRLRDFLLSWCNPETDDTEVTEMLRSASGAHYRDWLPGELSAALHAGELTPESLAGLTGGTHYPDQQAVQEWLRSVWPEWFSQAFPG